MSKPVIAIAIQTHPRRRQMRNDLIRQLAPSCPIISEDEASAGSWASGRGAWAQLVLTGADWGIVLQDDVGVCPRFTEVAHRALAALPTPRPVSFYCPNRKAADAYAQGLSWLVVRRTTWGQALCLPIPMAEQFLAWCAAHVRPECPYYDTRVTWFLTAAGQALWCTVPSLAEHLAPAASILGYNNRNKVASVPLPLGTDALAIEWTRGIDTPLMATGSPAARLRDWSIADAS